MIEKIVSGGQTGVDRAALDVAIRLNIPHGGWCPRGRAAEDGHIPERYQLRCPTDSDSEDKEPNIFNERTILNIRDSDGTLILVPAMPLPSTITDGTHVTIREIKNKRKPYLMIDLSKYDIDLIVRWVSKYEIKVLNIAGPRESKSPGIYEWSVKCLDNIFREVKAA